MSTPSTGVPEAAVEAAHAATGYAKPMLSVALGAAYPAILADFKEKLLGKGAVVAASTSFEENEFFSGEFPESAMHDALNAAFNKATEGHQ